MNSGGSLRLGACARVCAKVRELFAARAASALLVAAAMLALVALAPAAKAQATSPEYLFVAQPLTNPPTGSGIVTYIVDPTTGSLTPSSATPVVPRTPITGGLALNPAGNFLFAVSQFASDQSDISVFSVGANGQLTETPGSPYQLSQAKEVPVSAAVSPQGKYLYVASSFLPPQQQGQPAPILTTLIDEMAIADDGSLTVANTLTVAAPTVCPANAVPGPTEPVGVYLHPTHQWLYVLVNTESIPTAYVCDETAEVQTLTILSDDTLLLGTMIQGTAASVGYGITGTPDGSLILVSDGTSAAGIAQAFQIDQGDGGVGGGSTYIYKGSGALGAGPGAAVDSTSTYFYTPSAKFTFEGGILAATQTGPNVFNNSTELASPVWPFIFAASTTDGLISEQVNPDGTLAAAPGSPMAIAFPTQANPTGMVLTGATPVPNTPVLWITPTASPFTYTGPYTQAVAGLAYVTLSNQGFGPVNDTAVTFSGDPTMTLVNNCSVELPPGSSCTVAVNFAPTVVGTFTGNLSVAGQEYPITATTTTAGVYALLSPSPSPATLPDTKPGQTSAPVTITFTVPIISNGNSPITPTGITITGTNAQNFALQANNCTATIPVGGSCTATVNFSPTAVASYSAQLNFNSSTPNFQPTSVTLNGNGATNPAQYTLTLSPDGNGTITQSPAGSTFTANTIITVTAVPKSNGVFQYWNPGCKQSGNPVCLFPITENTVIGAVFAPIFPVSATAVGPGTVVSVSGANSYAGGSAEFNATPNVGASVASWSGPCASFGTDPFCVLNNLTGPVSVTVTFTQGTTYTLTQSVVGPGTISVMPAQSVFASNTPVYLQAVPAVDAVFTGWTAGPCAKSPNAICNFTILANTAVTANFAQKYTLSTSVNGSGTIQQSPAGTWFNTGTSVTLTAAPGTGAGFGSWTSGPCNGSTNPVCTFTVGTANLTAVAKFNGAFTLSTTAIGPGTIMQVPAGSSFAPGTSVTLTAVPNTGASFTSWAGVCVGSTNPVCTFAVNANTTATATFAASTNFTLATTVVGPGTITQTPTGTSFASGTSITLTAVPNNNATFTSWSGGACNSSPSPQCTFTITANTTVTATFAAAPKYTLATAVVGSGTITQTPSGTSFASGTSITLIAVPGANAAFTAWSGGACNGSSVATCTFAISANTTVTATFAAAPSYTLTTSASGPGTITQTPSGTSFTSGTSITLTAVPTSGATFVSWAGACAGSTNAVCTFAISANTSVTATFAAAAAVTPSQPSQTGGAGSAFNFTLDTSGFTTTPTLSAICNIPAGGCSISGTTLTVTTTARTSSVTRGVGALIPPATRSSGGGGAGSVLSATASLRLTLLALVAMLAIWTLGASAGTRNVVRMATLATGLMFLAACGGGGGGGGGATGTPAGTYTVTVTAMAGSQTATTKVTVTVN